MRFLWCLKMFNIISGEAPNINTQSKMSKIFTHLFQNGRRPHGHIVLNWRKQKLLRRLPEKLKYTTQAISTAILCPWPVSKLSIFWVQPSVFCKSTPSKWISTSCSSQGWGSRRGVGLWNVPFSLFLFSSSLSFLLNSNRKKNTKSRPGFSVHLKSFKHTAKISHTYQIIGRLCYTDFIGAYIKLMANFTTTTETLGSH